MKSQNTVSVVFSLKGTDLQLRTSFCAVSCFEFNCARFFFNYMYR